MFRAGLGLEGYGIYWVLIEKLYESGGRIAADFDAIAFDLRTDADKVKSVATKFGLFYLTGSSKHLASKSVDRRLQERRQRQEIARQNGLASGRARKVKGTAVEQPLNSRSTDPQLERKERKERKEITTASPSAVDLLIEGIKTDIPLDYSSWRFPKGFNHNYSGAYLTNVPEDECRKLLHTPRLGKKIRGALEWRINMKKQETAR